MHAHFLPCVSMCVYSAHLIQGFPTSLTVEGREETAEGLLQVLILFPLLLVSLRTHKHTHTHTHLYLGSAEVITYSQAAPH